MKFEDTETNFPFLIQFKLDGAEKMYPFKFTFISSVWQRQEYKWIQQN